MTSQHQPDQQDQPDTTCGAARQNRSGTEVYTRPCVLEPGHDGFHYGRNRRGEWEQWLYASDPRAQRGRVAASIHVPAVPDLSDERIAAVLEQWASEQAGPDDLAGGQQ